MELIAGRNLLPADEKRGVVINEAYLKELGLPAEDVIGKELWQNEVALSVVGVVKNFHTNSLRNQIKPVLIIENPSLMRRFSIKLLTNGGEWRIFRRGFLKLKRPGKKLILRRNSNMSLSMTV